ncbi:MAG: hypothetical protein WCH98_00275 [Verrucomicrobiota bacterium]
MRILCTALFPMWHYHFVSELNLIESHLDEGDDVTLLTCDGCQRACEPNPPHLLAHCLRCIGIRQHGQSLLSREVRTKPLIRADFIPLTLPPEFRNIGTVEDLKKCKVDEFDIGWAVFSSLVDRAGTEFPSLVENRLLVESLLLDSLRIYRTACAYLAEDKYDRVYIFNGRYAAARPWLRACASRGVTYVTHEKSSSLNRIFLYKNGIPHTTLGWPERMRAFWELNGNDGEVLKQAEDFFEERPKGFLTGWYSFTDKQRGDQMPADWDPKRKNAVIFSSTSNEFAGIKDLIVASLFESQLEAYSFIVKEASKRDPNLRFYLRIHPNSTEDKFRWWTEFDNETLALLTIIPPESGISSYTLLFNSDVVITPFSSIGIEATYWGKPSIVVDRPYYCGIDAVYEPQTGDEIVDLLAKDISPKPKINALKYSAFLRCSGFLLRHSNPLNYYTIDFKGSVLEARQEVHEWLARCEKRPKAGPIGKWLRDRNDAREFRKLWNQCGGKFAGFTTPVS